MNLNNLPPEMYDSLKIAGQDKHNAELDRLKEQAILKRQHKEKIKTLDDLSKNIESISKELTQHQQDNRKSERKQVFFQWFSFVISSLIGIGALIISIIALTL